MTQTQTQEGFAPAPIKRDPITINVGRVASVEKVYKSEKSKYGYFVAGYFDIQPIGAGKEHRHWMTFMPEWFDFNFKTSSLSGKPGRPDDIYRANIHDTKSLAFLKAVSGEKYGELCTALSKVDRTQDYDEYCSEMLQTLNDFFDKNRIYFGYVLAQDQEKVSKTVTNENGEEETVTEYLPKKWQSIQRLFEVTDENLEKERMKARKQAEKIAKAYEEGADKIPQQIKVTFEDGTPF